MEFIKLHSSEKLRLDEFLRRELPEKLSSIEIQSANEDSSLQVSNSKIRRLILSGAVKVNGYLCQRPAFELRNKSFIEISFEAEKFFYEKKAKDIAFSVRDSSVLFEDENLIFINKPAYFPVEQTITGKRDNLHDSTVDYLWKRNPQLKNPPYVGIMHRLDKDTSGIILFTKNRSVNKEISELFSSHKILKEYIAICELKDKSFSKIPKHFLVEKYIGRISSKSHSCKWGTLPETKGGLYSKTEFEVIRKLEIEGKNCVEFKCKLFTGRTHQIRVHLSEAGYPILGDEIYGEEGAKRMYLHGCHLKALNFDVYCQPQW